MLGLPAGAMIGILLCVDLEYKRAIEGKLLPIVILICNDCGYVRQIAAGKIGLLT